MALNVATLPLILCRQVKTIKHGSVRFNIVHFPILIFAVPFLLHFFISNDFSTCSCPFITTCIYTLYNLLSLLPRILHIQYGQVLLLKHARA